MQKTLASIMLLSSTLMAMRANARADTPAVTSTNPTPLIPDPATPPPTPRWTLGLRLGWHGMAQNRGANGPGQERPYDAIFSGRRRLMPRLELARDIWTGFGTLAIATSAGFTRATARALPIGTSPNEGRSTDVTRLTILPLSSSLVWRADFGQSRDAPLSIVPYARLGLDCFLWAANGNPGLKKGAALGWHAGAGLAVSSNLIGRSLAPAVFIELTRSDMTKFKKGDALQFGDTTLFAGVLFRF